MSYIRPEIAAVEEECGQPFVEVLKDHFALGYGTKVTADLLGLSQDTVRNWARRYNLTYPKRTRKELRLNEGQPTRETVEKAIAHNTKPISFNGLTLTPKEWASKLGIPVNTIYSRKYHGKSVAEMLRPLDTRFQGGRQYQ